MIKIEASLLLVIYLNISISCYFILTFHYILEVNIVLFVKPKYKQLHCNTFQPGRLRRITPTIIQICGKLIYLYCVLSTCLQFKMFNNLKLINFISSQIKTSTPPISVMRIMLNIGSVISQMSNWLTRGIQHCWSQPSGGSEGTAGGPREVT